MSDFKVGDKIARSTWNPESWFIIEWVGDDSYAGHREDGAKCVHMKRMGSVEWVKWTPPFPFKSGDVLRRSKDSVDGNHWEVVDPLPGSPSFMGRIIRSGNRDLRVREELTPYQKVCNNGEWELVPPTPTKKEFRLLTELRLPNQGETYVYGPFILGETYVYGPFILVATRDHRSDPQYVVTNVRPLDRV